MRSLAGVAIVMNVLAAPSMACAAVGSNLALTSDAAAALMSAAFTHDSAADQVRGAAPPPEEALTRLLDLANNPRRADAADHLITHQVADGAAVNTFQISTREAPAAGDLANPPTETYEVRVSRDWPGFLRLQSEHYGLDLTPHAGVGFSNRGDSAEAGAVLTFSPRLRSTLDRLGLSSGSVLGQDGRWYLFAAARGRAVGFNMPRNAAYDWNNAWSQDSATALVGDAQLGVGWRQGALQTSLGLIHRQTKADHPLWGQQAKSDSMLAVSLSIKPRR